MEKEKNNETESSGKVHFIIMAFVRIMLVLAFFGALHNKRWLVLFVSLFALFVTFLPKLLLIFFKVKIPAGFEVIVLLFIYGSLFFGDIRGFYAMYWWWDVLLNMVAAIAMGFVGLTILYALYKEEKIEASPLLVVIFAFCFSVAAGTLWEVFEFSIDGLFGFNLQGELARGVMEDLIVNIVGAFLVSAGGYWHIKSGRKGLFSSFVLKLINKNPKIFGIVEKPEEKVHKLIKSGESEKLEFKSTLRKNLHTGQIDKKIEMATLKTMVAHMNSNGGTLLVGVSDSGEIIGVEKEEFANKDKLALHFTNLIKWHIGDEYMPFINFNIMEIEDKYLLKVDCRESDKPVFLKTEGAEEFFIRNGPSSTKLDGSQLIDYANRRFGKE